MSAPENIRAIKSVAEHDGWKLATDGEHYFAVPEPCVVSGPTLSHDAVAAYLCDGQVAESTLCFVYESLASRAREAPRKIPGLRVTGGRVYV